jgi:hypothetical protein
VGEGLGVQQTLTHTAGGNVKNDAKTTFHWSPGSSMVLLLHYVLTVVSRERCRYLWAPVATVDVTR